MTYEELITTMSAIFNDDSIIKKDLTLTYALDPKNHKAMNEILFYKTNPITENPLISDEFEADINGITVKFVKKK